LCLPLFFQVDPVLVPTSYVDVPDGSKTDVAQEADVVLNQAALIVEDEEDVVGGIDQGSPGFDGDLGFDDVAERLVMVEAGVGKLLAV